MNLELRSCPLCGSSEVSKVLVESNFDPSRMNNYSFSSRKRPEFMHFRMVVCSGCSLCYASPIPEFSWFHDNYVQADFDAAGESGYAARSYADWLEKKLGPLPAYDGALDIGTGDGAFLGELLGRGLTHVAGVEPSAAPVASAKPHVAPHIHQGFFDPGMYSPESFMLISCFQAIEHLHDPRELFRSACGLLRPGGCLFIVAHNYRSLSARILGARSPIFDIEHLQLVSPASTARLFREAGFGDVGIYNFSNRYPISYWLKLAPLKRAVKEKLEQLLQRAGSHNLTMALPAGNIAAVGFKPKTAD